MEVVKKGYSGGKVAGLAALRGGGQQIPVLDFALSAVVDLALAERNSIPDRLYRQDIEVGRHGIRFGMARTALGGAPMILTAY